MSTAEVWMGSGVTMTMIPESKLFLGYQPLGPSMGDENTKYANMIRYHVGFATDTPTTATKTFEDYYELVPDLYAGCTAEFWYTESAAAATLQFTATVVTNDKTGIYFSGNLADFPTLFHGNDGTGTIGDASTANPKGYIILQKHGAVVPAPLAFEATADTSVTVSTAATANFTTSDAKYYSVGDFIFVSGARKAQVTSISGTTINMIEDSGLNTTGSGGSGAPGSAGSNGGVTNGALHTITLDLSGDGKLIAGQYINNGASTPASFGRICSVNGTTVKVFLAAEISNTDDISKGMHDHGFSSSALQVGYLRTLSDNWLGLIDSATPSTTEVTVEPKMMAIGGTRNATYQLKGIETAGSASLDATLNHGTWLHYALGSTDLTFPTIVGGYLTNPFDATYSQTTTGNFDHTANTFTRTSGTNFSQLEAGMSITITNAVDSGNNATVTITSLTDTVLTLSAVDASETGDEVTITVESYGKHKTLVATNGSAAEVAGNTDGPLFHRVLKGSDAICPPLLPGTAANEVTEPSVGGDGLMDNGFVYTFTERNDSTLPSFAFELVAEKGGNVASIPQVDRGTTARQTTGGTDTFDTKDTAYAQIHPGATMESMTLTASAESAVTANMSFNVKRTFECPTGYVGRAYDETNNDTSGAQLPRVLNNFGQTTGVNTAVEQEFLTPYYFSDGTISLFGSEFMRVTNFGLTINNGLTDKRYIGQYNKQIKSVVTGTRTYEITMTAQLTDRRLFAELRNEESFRSAMSHSNIQLLLEKATGERIKLQFDDFMVSVATFPGPTDDRGPLEVSFTIMPIRKGSTIDTKTAWVLQG